MRAWAVSVVSLAKSCAQLMNRGICMSATLIIVLLLGPLVLLVAIVGGVIGYMLAQKRYLELFNACQIDQAEAQASLDKLRDMASELTSRVDQHNSCGVGTEQPRATVPPDEPGGKATAAAAAGLREANQKLQADLLVAKRQLDDQTKRLKREQRDARVDK